MTESNIKPEQVRPCECVADELRELWKAALEREASLRATVESVASLVDEESGYVSGRRRFMPVDSVFTNALRDALGVPRAGSALRHIQGGGES